MNWTLKIKYVLAEILYRLGLIRWLLHKRLQGGVVVLMYHRVLPESIWQKSLSTDSIIVTPTTFCQHMAWLKDELELLDQNQFRNWLLGVRELQKPGCLITFDDGWYDNHAIALPLLRQANAPAMICIATDYIGTQDTFWQEELGQRLWALTRSYKPETCSFLTTLGLLSIRSLPAARQRQRIISTVRSLKSLPWIEIEDILSKARNLLPEVDNDSDKFMNWDQVRELHRSGVTLFSHGCSHRTMTSLDSKKLSRELMISRQRLEEEVGVSTDTLAYPNGNHNDNVITAATAHDYNIAFTTEPGIVRPGDNPMKLKRINMQEHSTRTPAMLACRLLGIF